MAKRKEEHILECRTRLPSGKVIYEQIKQTKEESDKWFKNLREWVQNGKKRN